LSSSLRTYATPTYGFVSDAYGSSETDFTVVRDLLDRVKIRTDSVTPIFVGIGPAAAVEAYLGRVRHAEAKTFDAEPSDFHVVGHGRLRGPPAAQPFWVASARGTGPRTLTWNIRDGRWRAVLMNLNGLPQVSASVSVGARVPNLAWIGVGVAGGG